MTDPLDFGYDSYLEQVPEALRDQIKPAFDEYSSKIKSGVEEQYGPIAPLKEYIDQGFTPDHFTAGLELLQMANNNPQQVMQGLLENYPELAQQFAQQYAPAPTNTPPVGSSPPSDGDDPYEARFSQIDQVLQLLTQGYTQQQQTVQQQQQQVQEQEEMKQFQSELDRVAPEDKYPRRFILSYVAEGMAPEKAVQAYTDWQTSQFQRQASNGTPLVAPASGGGLVSEGLDTSKLSDIDRKHLMVQYLEQAKRQQ